MTNFAAQTLQIPGIRARLLVGMAIAGVLVGGVTRITHADQSDYDPTRWQAAIDRFEAEDAEQSPAENGIVFVGSSSIRMWDLDKYFPDIDAINRGFGGSEIEDVNHFLKPLVLKHRPRVVVLYSGDNDVVAGKSAEEVHHDFRAFVAGIHDTLPETRIVVIAIKPSIARWQHAETMRAANELIAGEAAENEKLVFVDIWPAMLGDDGGRPPQKWFIADGLHLSHEGYLLWSSLVRPHLVAP